MSTLAKDHEVVVDADLLKSRREIVTNSEFTHDDPSFAGVCERSVDEVVAMAGSKSLSDAVAHLKVDRPAQLTDSGTAVVGTVTSDEVRIGRCSRKAARRYGFTPMGEHIPTRARLSRLPSPRP